MIKRSAVTVVALAAGMLTACSSSGSGGGPAGTGNYCVDLKAAATYFNKLNSSSSSADLDFSTLQSTFAKLGSEAPSSLKSDWQQLNSAVQEVLDALSKAGLKPSDLESAAALPPDKLQKLEQVGQELDKDSAKFDAPSNRITADAKTRCGVTLSSD